MSQMPPPYEGRPPFGLGPLVCDETIRRVARTIDGGGATFLVNPRMVPYLESIQEGETAHLLHLRTSEVVGMTDIYYMRHGARMEMPEYAEVLRLAQDNFVRNVEERLRQIDRQWHEQLERALAERDEAQGLMACVARERASGEVVTPVEHHMPPWLQQQIIRELTVTPEREFRVAPYVPETGCHADGDPLPEPTLFTTSTVSNRPRHLSQAELEAALERARAAMEQRILEAEAQLFRSGYTPPTQFEYQENWQSQWEQYLPHGLQSRGDAREAPESGDNLERRDGSLDYDAMTAQHQDDITLEEIFSAQAADKEASIREIISKWKNQNREDVDDAANPDDREVSDS